MTLPGIYTLYRNMVLKWPSPGLTPQINLQWYKDTFNRLDFPPGSSKECPVLLSCPNSH